MDGLRVELCGDLAEILSFAASDARKVPARVNASGTKGGVMCGFWVCCRWLRRHAADDPIIRLWQFGREVRLQGRLPSGGYAEPIAFE